MGIRFYCPNGHKLNVKAFQAGRKGICPYCGSKIKIPLQSTRKSAKDDSAVGRHVQSVPAAAGAAGFTPVPTEIASAPAAIASPALRTAGHSAPAASGYSSPAQPAQTSHAVIPQRSAPVTPVSDAAPVAAPQAVAPAGHFAAPAAPAQPAPAVPAASPDSSGPSASVPRDPLSEGGDVVWYVRPPSGGQFGPAAPDVMRGWIDQGRVSGDSLVWREGWRDWQEAAEVFPQLGAGQEQSPFGQMLPGVGGGAVGPGGSPAGQRARSRRRSQTVQVAIVSVLIIAVAILLGVFLWVLQQGETSPEDDNARASVSAATVAWQAPLPQAHP